MAQLPGVSDDRGSKPQKILFDMCCDIYGQNNVYWELMIPDLGQRFDIFIKHLGVAIEFDGRQHTEYVPHFHKDECGYIASIKRDSTKSDWANTNGIAIVRFNDSNIPNNVDSLKSIVSNSIIDSDYSFECFTASQNKTLADARAYRKQQYLNMKHNDRRK